MSTTTIQKTALMQFVEKELNGKTFADFKKVFLTAICKDFGLKRYSNLSKSGLWALIMGAYEKQVMEYQASMQAEVEEINRPEVGVLKGSFASPKHVEYNEVRKGFFNIGETHQAYEGFTKGGSWNGWACPYFTYEVALEVLEHIRGENDTVRYKVSEDCFEVYFENSWTDEEPETFIGQHIEFNGERIKVYDIGAYSWVWDEVKLDDDYEKAYFESSETIFYMMDGRQLKAAEIFKGEF